MAQTGYTPILIYSSTTASQAPSASNLTNSTLGSELAINITDGKLFYKDNANAVQVIGWKTVPTSAGGTGLTSYTAGDMLYYASGTTLTKLAIGASGRWLGSSGTAPQWNAPAALTKTDDTNVTLTLGGSASTALLNAASLTLGWTGTLAVSRGGTGTGTAFTAGSVIFAGASGVYSQNNAKLFWDNTNNRLGIGTASPGRPFTIEAAASAGLNAANPSIRLNDTTSGRFVVFDYDSNQLLTIWNGDTGVAGADIIFKYGSGSGTEGLRLVNNGDMKLANGNFIPSTAAKGINFTANTGAAGKTSQLLNWYEEGTWTPALSASTPGNFTPTYTTQEASYTRIGRKVTVTGRIYLTSFTNTTGSGDLFITGLPFTPSGYYAPGSLEFAGVTKVGYTQFTPFATPSQTYLRIDCSASATAVTTLQVTDLTAGGRPYFVFQVTYQV